MGLGAPWWLVRLKSGGKHSGRGACVSLEAPRHLGGESLREGGSVSGWEPQRMLGDEVGNPGGERREKA